MEDTIDILDNIREQKNWSHDVFLEKIVEFAERNDIAEDLVDHMLSLEPELLSEDSIK